MMTAKELRSKNKRADKEIKKYIGWQNEEIIKANEKGRTRTCFRYWNYSYEDEIKQYYINLGYTFKPTGYIGGVWQDTEDICW